MKCHRCWRRCDAVIGGQWQNRGCQLQEKQTPGGQDENQQCQVERVDQPGFVRSGESLGLHRWISLLIVAQTDKEQKRKGMGAHACFDESFDGLRFCSSSSPVNRCHLSKQQAVSIIKRKTVVECSHEYKSRHRRQVRSIQKRWRLLSNIFPGLFCSKNAPSFPDHPPVPGCLPPRLLCYSHTSPPLQRRPDPGVLPYLAPHTH